jgi:hypothetical protein
LSIDHAIPVDGRISMSRLLSNAASRLGAQALEGMDGCDECLPNDAG